MLKSVFPDSWHICSFVPVGDSYRYYDFPRIYHIWRHEKLAICFLFIVKIPRAISHIEYIHKFK